MAGVSPQVFEMNRANELPNWIEKREREPLDHQQQLSWQSAHQRYGASTDGIVAKPLKD
jgi:hypothetical protein